MIPSYLKLHKNGKLAKIKDRLISELENCELCPRNCKVDRLKGETGFCKTGRNVLVSSYNLHFGEEPPLVGTGGSGTIFFTWCNLGCIFCQNFSISHLGEGHEVKPQDLADIMLSLQQRGAHNINFVTPTHVIAQIVEALIPAIEKGLKLPLVYNSGGYDKPETLMKIAGIFDIYMPDAKYSDEHHSGKYSGAGDYWQICRKALVEMHKQVGGLVINEKDIAERGLLIRHLVLPNGIAGSFEILDFIAEKLSRDSYVNIMEQYHPCFKADRHEDLSRRITMGEFKEVLDHAVKAGLHRGF
ncbi:MAG: radical SAM protein [Candidatus Omnitrophota bacterium]|nr:radical SAM protein [Candidatus Omnitrophota bacterium]